MGLTGLLLGLHRAEAPVDSDVLWSTRNGLDVLSSGRLASHDTYSWTAAGREWLPNSWAWNVVLGGAYRVADQAGIWVIGIGLAVGLAIAVALSAARVGAMPLPTVMLFAVLGGLLLVVDPRAQTLAFFFVLAIPPLTERLVSVDVRRALTTTALICGLQILWMNLHSAALVGPPLVAVVGVGAIAATPQGGHRRRASLQLGVAVVAVSLCLLATPYGTAPLRHVDDVRNASVGLINEWAHPGFENFAQVVSLVAIALGIGAVVVAACARRYGEVGALALFIALTLSAVRFAPLIVVAALPELAIALGRVEVRPVMQRRIVALELVVLTVLPIAGAGTFAMLSDSSSSPRLVKALPRDCRLVNDYTVGAAVILLRPDVKVSVDGRNDMYGRAGVLAAIDLLRDVPGTRARIDAAGVRCVLAPQSAPLAENLSGDPGWRVAGTDGARVLLVRLPPGAGDR